MTTKRVFHTLDGLRGVAALSVVVLHTPELTQPFTMPSAFLAVDLFFMLSGFVIAHAYDARFAAGMGLREFLYLRVSRLYPLFALGALAGVLITAAGLTIFGATTHWTWGKLLTSAPFALLMLPTPAPGALYPPNPVGWSLFFELAINLIYAALWRRFQSRAFLAAGMLVSAAALAGLTVLNGDAEMGATWSEFGGGLARATFGFLTGVAIFRVNRRLGEAHRFKASPWLALAAALAVFALPRGPWSLGVDLAAIMLLFPVLILTAARNEPSPRWTSLFAFLGATSYAVYALNKPLAVAAFAVIEKLGHFSLDSVAPWSGLAFITALLASCAILDRVYDQPVRRFLARLNPKVRRGPVVIEPGAIEPG